jgi:hypothetical protein
LSLRVWHVPVRIGREHNTLSHRQKPGAAR